jgi:membrane-anchored protein YejM (alkaline phosphatase superfamily)
VKSKVVVLVGSTIFVILCVIDVCVFRVNSFHISKLQKCVLTTYAINDDDERNASCCLTICCTPINYFN